jgi:hypothetical protein
LVEQKVTLNLTQNGWNSFDIPLTQFPLVNLSNITQFKLVGLPSGSGIMYWDNLFFWKSSAVTTPTISVTQPSCASSFGSVAVTSSTTGLSFSINGTDYSNTSGQFNNLLPGVYALTSRDAQGNISTAVSFTINNAPSLPVIPAVITGTYNINQCDTIQMYCTSSAQTQVLFNWSVTGTGNRVYSNQGNDTVFLVMKSAGTISVSAYNSCGSSTARTFAVVKSIPPTPTVLTATSTNICLFTSSAFAIRGIRDTVRTRRVAGATGYHFEVPAGAIIQRLNDTCITVIFSDTNTVGSLKVYSLSACDTSLAKTLVVSRTTLSAPASITVNALSTNVCGNRRYRYSAPALPVGALGYSWTFVGNLFSSAYIDSGSLTSQKIILVYTSNAAAATGDSAKLAYTGGCGRGLFRSIKLTNTLLSAPAAPASITVQAIQTNVCGIRKYRYLAPNLPAATTTAGAATGYDWSFTGNLFNSATIDSGTLTSQKLVVTYSSNDSARIGDSIRLRYNSACGYGVRRASKLTNTRLNPPAAPASISIQLVQDLCYMRKYRYVAPALPAATTTSGAATGYLWSMPTGSLGSIGVLDSGTLNSQKIIIRYNSNAGAAAGDSIRLRYTSNCGNGLIKAQILSNVAKICTSLVSSASSACLGTNVLFMANIQTEVPSSSFGRRFPLNKEKPVVENRSLSQTDEKEETHFGIRIKKEKINIK